MTVEASKYSGNSECLEYALENGCST
jgi:hypothetical protein